MYEWLVQNAWILWLSLFLLLAVIEMLTLDLYFILMSAGALAAAIAFLLGAPFWLQIVVFSVVAIAMTIFVRPVAIAHLRKGPREQRTNIDRLIGHSAVVVSPVSADGGLVKIGGDTWTARIRTGELLPVGQDVEVAAIEGATAIVVLRGTSASPDSSATAAGH
ncbi:NfeD family protein [Arthrobacter sp. 35W]|uniref:NfeD family protein n=1 Tax=Arthrobacter sp. 35W TaxID=1132441 RepID=UPI00042A72D6|nr:NfeD family protein [Arthrobacter sp. 35W]